MRVWIILAGFVLAALVMAAYAHAQVPSASIRLLGTTAWGDGWYLNIPADVEGKRIGALWYWPAYQQFNYGVEWDRPLDFVIRLRNDGRVPLWVRFEATQCAPWERAWTEREGTVVMPGRAVDIRAWYVLDSTGFETPIDNITLSVGCAIRLSVAEVDIRK